MKKSSNVSYELSEQLLSDLRKRLPYITVRNRSVTTSSIYCKTPDGFSLRIGDHRGREKYSYKWNLGPQFTAQGQWVKEFCEVAGRDYWRFYTSSVETLAVAIEANVQKMNERSGAWHMAHDIMTTRAAKMFGVKEEDVTQEQRTATKAVYFGHDYGSGPCAYEQFLGRTKRKKEKHMTVFPMLDKKSGEVILIYRNKRKGEKIGWLDAEVYKFHDELFNVASHYGAYNINEEYLATLELPTEKDMRLVETAVSFYQAHLKKCDGTKVVRSFSKTFVEYHEARAKFPLDKPEK